MEGIPSIQVEGKHKIILLNLLCSENLVAMIYLIM